MASVVVPVSSEVNFIGKRIKSSKQRHVWSFYVRRDGAADPAVDNYFECELLCSKKSAKRRISVNGHLMKQVAGKADESVKICIAGLALEAKQLGKQYDLIIGGQSFARLFAERKCEEVGDQPRELGETASLGK